MVLLSVVSAVACVAGLRLAALGLASAGVGLLLATPSLSETVVAWIVLSAAALIALGTDPRRVALPLLGCASVAVAVTSTNAAAFLPAWVVGTLILSARPHERRLPLLLCDVPVTAAALWIVLASPLELWRDPVAAGPAVLLVIGALSRTLVLDVDEAPLAVVGARGQALLGLGLVAGTSPTVVTVAGAALLAAGALAPGGTRRDVMQDVGLAAVLVGVSFGDPRVAFAALAAGTLLHAVAASAGAPGPGRLLGRVAAGGGLGTPLWPVAALALGLALRTGGPVAALVCLAVVVGLWGRTYVGAALRGTSAAGPVVAGAAVALGLWSPLATGGGIGEVWPGPLGLAPVFAAAAAGAAAAIRGTSLAPVAPAAGEVASAAARIRLPLPTLAGPGWLPVAVSAGLVGAALGCFAVAALKGFL